MAAVCEATPEREGGREGGRGVGHSHSGRDEWEGQGWESLSSVHHEERLGNIFREL